MMTDYDRVPIGMIRYEELLNMLTAVALAGGDIKTLVLVAQSAGLGPAFVRWIEQMKAERQRLLSVWG
jgi:hypothetical protein